MADVFITLNVDTNQITIQNVDANCNFGQGPGITNENFLTIANGGDTINWVGVSTSSDSDEVNITNIIHDSGGRVFSQDNLHGNGAQPENVVGVVMSNARGLTSKYTIQFNVFNNGVRRPGTFKIDPKLQINP